MLKLFKDVAENTNFNKDGIEYIKTATVRVSCCKSINARTVGDANQTIFVSPETEVETND
jgi:hypothetical protein